MGHYGDQRQTFSKAKGKLTFLRMRSVNPTQWATAVVGVSANGSLD